jgi:hypothetical protein
MSMSVGASSNALSYLQSLLGQDTSGAGGTTGADPLSALLQSLTGTSPDASQTSGQTTNQSASQTGASAGYSPFGSDTMAALISLQGEGASGVTAQSPSALFAKLDTDGDGQISKSEFEKALSGAGVSTSAADTAFAKLDANGDGSVSQSELASAHGHGGPHHMHGGGGAKGGSSAQSGLDSLLSATGADGATTQTSSNADGSTTTTITYADGSSIASTTPASSAGGSTSGSGKSGSSNLLQQLTQLQSQLIGAAASTLSAIA